MSLKPLGRMKDFYAPSQMPKVVIGVFSTYLILFVERNICLIAKYTPERFHFGLQLSSTGSVVDEKCHLFFQFDPVLCISGSCVHLDICLD